MSFGQTVSRYLAAYEGHSEYEGQGLEDLVNMLSRATLFEINAEYNALSQQHLWIQPLLDAFHDELLNRLVDEMSFVITLQESGVILALGFGDEYPPITPPDGYIPNRVSGFTLLNDDFSEDVAKEVSRRLLIPIDTALVENGNRIIGLIDVTEFEIGFGNRLGGEVTQVPVETQMDPEFRFIYSMYQGVKGTHPGIIDPRSENLIQQLVDLPTAYKIMADGGITFEGDLLLRAEEEEED